MSQELTTDSSKMPVSSSPTEPPLSPEQSMTVPSSSSLSLLTPGSSQGRSTKIRSRAGYGKSLERSALAKRRTRYFKKNLKNTPWERLPTESIPDHFKGPSRKRKKTMAVNVDASDINLPMKVKQNLAKLDDDTIVNTDSSLDANLGRVVDNIIECSDNNIKVNTDKEMRVYSDVKNAEGYTSNNNDNDEDKIISSTDEDSEIVTSTDSDESGDEEESNKSQEEIITDGQTNKMFSIDFENAEWSHKMKFKDGITKLYMIVTIIATAIRGKLTYAIMELMFRSMKLMTINSGLPCTVKHLWKILNRNDDATTTRHLYCQECGGYLGKGKTPGRSCACGMCGPTGDNPVMSYFIEVKITPQLNQLFADAAIVQSLNYRFERTKKNPDGIEDIYDGVKYREECKEGGFLENENNFSFTLFTDGCSVSNSSNVSAWPIFLQINEFSPHARKRYVMLAGIWVDKVHPDLNTILLPTIQELEMLYAVGIEWTHPINETVIKSKFRLLICTVDSVARSMIMNMTQFNGQYGCTFCYAEGKSAPVGTKGGHHRIYTVDEIAALRTNDEIRNAMEEAHNTETTVRGVKGIAAMSALLEFDFESGIVVDSMHNVYMGVAKSHTKLLLDGKRTDNWYRGSASNITEIDSRLTRLRPPNRISRMPRSIKDRKQWKASEWRNWIQFYAVPCLDGIIPDEDRTLLSMLSWAVYILNKSSILGADELNTAQTLLQRYVTGYQTRYGTTNMSYNVYLLTHLTNSVRNWGPFWTHSAFPFESWNKKIVDQVTSANSRPLQIVTRFCMTRFIQGFFNEPKVPLAMKNHIDMILTAGLKRHKKNTTFDRMPTETSTLKAIGKVITRQTEEWELQVLRSAGYETKTVSCMKTAVIMGIEYRTRDCATKTKFCNKYIYWEYNKYAEILQIVRFDHNDNVVCGFLVRLMSTDGWAFETGHIANVEITDEIQFVCIDVAPEPAILIKAADQRLHMIRLPNVWETD